MPGVVITDHPHSQDQKLIVDEFKEIHDRQQETHEKLITGLLENQKNNNNNNAKTKKKKKSSGDSSEGGGGGGEVNFEELNRLLDEEDASAKNGGEVEHAKTPVTSASTTNGADPTAATPPEIKMFVAPDSEAILMSHGESGMLVLFGILSNSAISGLTLRNITPLITLATPVGGQTITQLERDNLLSL